MQIEDLHKGMTVFSADGERVGDIADLGERTFLIEKGALFKKEFFARYEDVSTVQGDTVNLRLLKDELLKSYEEAAAAVGKAPAGEAAMGRTTEGAATPTGESERIALHEERLDVQKRREAAGEVRARKEVITEERQVSVPVTREQVVVERVPVTEARPSSAADIGSEEVSIPLTEERVEVEKRPVVTEEVRLRKEAVPGEETITEDVRREELRLEGDGEGAAPLPRQGKRPERRP